MDPAGGDRVQPAADDDVPAGPRGRRVAGRRVVVHAARPAGRRGPRRDDGRGARAAGRCRASATGRSTRTCRCRSRARRPASRTRTRPACTAARSTVPAAWAGQRIVLHVGRGRVGAVRRTSTASPSAWARTRGSRTSSTSPVSSRPGRPFELTLTVVRWSDATYLEDQDHWYHAGLHRSVLLYAHAARAHRRRPTRSPTATRRPGRGTRRCGPSSRARRGPAGWTRPGVGSTGPPSARPTSASSTRPAGP